MGGQSCRQAAYQRSLDHRVSRLAACFLKITVDEMDGCPRRRLAFTMLDTLGELSLFALVFSDFLIEGAHRVVYVSDGDNPRPSSGKRDQSSTNQAALIGMKFADEAIKSRATRRSNSTWGSSGSAGCPAGKVERCLVMIGVRLPKEGGPVGTIFRRRFSAICLSANCWPTFSRTPSENIRLSAELRGIKDALLRVAQSSASRSWSKKINSV